MEAEISPGGADRRTGRRFKNAACYVEAGFGRSVRACRTSGGKMER